MLDPAIIKDGLLDLQANPPPDEAGAITRLATVLITYFAGAEAGGIPIAGADTQQVAVEGGLAGLKAAAAPAIQTAVLAFWTTVCAGPAPFFAGFGPPGVPSASLTTLAALMQAAAAANVAAQLPPPDACQAIADAIHAAHATPSTITLLSGPTVTPIT